MEEWIKGITPKRDGSKNCSTAMKWADSSSRKEHEERWNPNDEDKSDKNAVLVSQ